MDPKELRISGDYNSETARLINIQLKRCEGQGCKSESEITDYFRNKFLLVLMNEAHFKTDKFGQARVLPEARLSWIRINTYAPQTMPFSVQQT